MTKLSELVVVTQDIVNKVNKHYGKSDEDIKKDVEILRDWLKKQQHLPQIIDDAELGKLLMRNKFRIEQTKKKIDSYFSLRGEHYFLFDEEGMNMNTEKMRQCLKTVWFCPLPKQTDTGERVTLIVVKDEAAELFHHFEFAVYFFMQIELLNSVDYSMSQRIIIDAKNLKASHYLRLDPVLFYKAMTLWLEAYSARLAGIEIFNAPSYVDFLVKLLSTGLKDGKIKVHSTYESLYDIVPKSILPKEFGGECGCFEELKDEWVEEVEDHKEFLMKRAKLISDESKRVGKLEKSDQFGVEGTFKKLNLD